MRLAWLTDVHLNFVYGKYAQNVFKSLARQVDAFVISGDIAESYSVCNYLRQLNQLKKPVYFVLGNHDFYHGSISKVRKLVAAVASEFKYLKYLTAMGIEELTPKTAIIGHDGWADGQFGDYTNSVLLNDHLLIADLVVCWDGTSLNKQRLKPILAALANEAAKHFALLETSNYPNIIAVTHVPPFREAAWHRGKTSSDDFLPHFTSKIVGEVLQRVMQTRPKSKLLVLCGHTHSGGEIKVLDNLRVLTGDAEYGLLKHCILTVA